MKRSDGEIVRIREHVARMRSALDTIEIILKGGPVGVDEGQTILTNAGALCSALARLGAYQLAEDDAEGVVCKFCEDTHVMTLWEPGSDERVVPCTRCPVPCQKCRAGGKGAYCARPRCRCACHA